MNRVIVTGNLTKNPEGAVAANGKTWATVTLAVDRQTGHREGEEREAYFPRFVCYDKTADNAMKYLAKGRKVLVEGHIQTSTYQKDGKTIFSTTLVADRIEYLSARKANEESTGSAAAQEAPSASGVANVDPATGMQYANNDEDLPF